MRQGQSQKLGTGAEGRGVASRADGTFMKVPLRWETRSDQQSRWWIKTMASPASNEVDRRKFGSFNPNSAPFKLSSPSRLRISWLTFFGVITELLQAPLGGGLWVRRMGRNHSLPRDYPEDLSLTNRQILQRRQVYSRSSHNSSVLTPLFLRALCNMSFCQHNDTFASKSPQLKGVYKELKQNKHNSWERYGSQAKATRV